MTFPGLARLLEGKDVLLVAFAIVALAALILIISLFAYRKGERKYRRSIGGLSNSLRVYVVDVKNDKVRYFNRSNLRKRRSSSITDFYNQFPAAERDRLINWIAELIDDPEKAGKSLEINVLSRRSRRSFFSVLDVQKVDQAAQVIHLESYILPYISERRSRKGALSFSSREAFSQAVMKSAALKGVTFALDFFGRKMRYAGNAFPRVIFSQVKDILSSYLTPTRLMLETSPHEIVVAALKATSRAKALQVISSVREAVNRHLLVSSFADEVGFSVGVVENRFFPNEPDKLIENALYVARLAHEEASEQILWYEKGMNASLPGDYTYRTEVERIIRDKKLAYTYRLIYDAARLRPFGYLSRARPVGTVFETLGELKDYAVRTEDDRALFGTIAKNVISTFISESYDADLRLFFPIRFAEKNNVMRTLPHIAKIKETRVVLVLEEEELSDIVVNRDEIIVSDVRSLKVKGYEVALVLDDSELTLTPRVYELFDYYIIGGYLTRNVKTDARARLRLHGLIEKLLPFQRPIIASDLANWSDVELIVKLGVDLISSEIVSPANELVVPIAQKSENKIKAIRPEGNKRGS